MRIARRANCEMHYDFGAAGIYDSLATAEFRTHAFIAVHEERAIGFAVIEKRTHVWRCRWSDRDRDYNAGGYRPPKLPDSRPRFAAVFAWTLPRFRRQGLARRLIEQAAAFAAVPIAELGWCPPFSEAGEVLVRKLCPEQYLVMK